MRLYHQQNTDPAGRAAVGFSIDGRHIDDSQHVLTLDPLTRGGGGKGCVARRQTQQLQDPYLLRFLASRGECLQTAVAG